MLWELPSGHTKIEHLGKRLEQQFPGIGKQVAQDREAKRQASPTGVFTHCLGVTSEQQSGTQWSRRAQDTDVDVKKVR